MGCVHYCPFGETHDSGFKVNVHLFEYFRSEVMLFDKKPELINHGFAQNRIVTESYSGKAAH